MDDLRRRILRDLLQADDITLSDDQEEALRTFVTFMKSDEERSAFLLTGSAGTGKTFLISLFTELLRKSGFKVILLAPTGRAAKVITRRTRRLAYTIHHHIYSPREDFSGDMWFERKPNKEPANTVYVVDEASMIGDKAEDGMPGSLLRDLIAYVYQDHETRKLIIVGDPVQLPPVGFSDSPALDPIRLERTGDLTLYHTHLTEVKRQQADSGVLENAVLIRDAFLSSTPEHTRIEPNRDVQVMDQAWEALETYMGYYQEGNLDRVIFITYSNYQAARINQAIRAQLHHTQEPLTSSDLLMVVRNNYAWGDPKRMPFIANGEMGVVRRVLSDEPEKRYGLTWMDVEIEFQDNRGEAYIIECKVILDLLSAKQPQLDSTTFGQVIQARRIEYASIAPSRAAELLRTDPYINALQVKYGYAVTGHKSQGGQWENVLINFEPDYGQDALAHIRWVYTVFTRAESRVFLLNCPFLGDT
ncbi:MAG: AAA family ATPase [Bacteroidia bacterium]|nr:AAA family ATPase [Bacteroidia bacterium]